MARKSFQQRWVGYQAKQKLKAEKLLRSLQRLESKVNQGAYPNLDSDERLKIVRLLDKALIPQLQLVGSKVVGFRMLGFNERGRIHADVCKILRASGRKKVTLERKSPKVILRRPK